MQFPHNYAVRTNTNVDKYEACSFQILTLFLLQLIEKYTAKSAIDNLEN